MIVAYLKLFVMVILTSLSQILIKIGSGKIITGRGRIELFISFFNLYIIIGMALVAAAPVLYFSALSMISLNTAYSVTGLGYIIVIISGRFILKEHISIFHITGGLLIFGGFMVWNMGAGLY